VGIEPPDIYCLKNDYFDLMPDRSDEIASRVAQTWLLDEFLLRSETFHSLRVGKIEESGKLDKGARIKFQPHCHQRAEGMSADGLPIGVNATEELLRSCGFDLDVLDTGCCGMAGTFGYEAEHYELSMRVGELKLFPLLQSITEPEGQLPHPGSGGEVAASGAACRMQIEHGTGLRAAHPIILVRAALLG
jgi:Fe-S oxidoreductase